MPGWFLAVQNVERSLSNGKGNSRMRTARIEQAKAAIRESESLGLTDDDNPYVDIPEIVEDADTEWFESETEAFEFKREE